ncbi:MAG: glycosyltransferase family A protein [Nocardioides sp.]|uniref:glycosyltransferase family A protein n=1 Tax=Nocardioides sp. TaxID=35761 RepID=UPI0039E3D4C0
MSEAPGPQITTILTGHAEGQLIGVTFRSMLDAVAAARATGLEVEMMVVLDKPDPATAEALAEAEEHGCRVLRVSFPAADHASVRNHAVEQARGEYVAFLDGDDLWTENWLVEAHAMCQTDPGRVIAHPEVDWIFDHGSNLWFLLDQTDPAFDPAYLRVFNYWDVLCLAPRAAYLEHPRQPRAIEAGYAYEDWHWNLQTVGAGYLHRVVPETIHFKRRRKASQLTVAISNRSLTPDHELLTYRGMAAWESRTGETG